MKTLVLCVVASLLGGCGPYRLEGFVVRGETSMVEIVDSGDPRLSESGLAGASVQLTMEPERLNRKVVAEGVSDGAGAFSLPVDEFGAGLLEYDFALSAKRKGFQNAEGYFRLPGGGRRVLVTLAPGASSQEEDDLDALIQELKSRRR